MKKLFSYSALGVAAALLLTSCGQMSSLSISKRHYNSGYYVDFGGKKQAESKTVAANNANQVNQNIASAPATAITSSAVNADVQMQTVSNSATTTVSKKAKKQMVSDIAIAKTNKIGTANVETTVSQAAPENVDSISQTTDNHSGIDTLLLVIITILLPPLGVALAVGIGGPFWLDLILTLLFYIPGLIYGLIVVLG
jgi:uncharacterized membrane protein YqaE (UPF0057 family)